MSGSGTAVRNITIFVEKCIFLEIMKIGTRMQDTQYVLNITDDLNRKIVEF